MSVPTFFPPLLQKGITFIAYAYFAGPCFFFIVHVVWQAKRAMKNQG